MPAETVIIWPVLQLLCIGIIFDASMHDIVGRIVPNRFPLALAVLGITIQATNGHMIGSLVTGSFIFLLAALCWRCGWMGGGDVKLLGAAALALPPHIVPLFIAAVAISGGLLAFFYLGGRTLIAAPPTRLSLKRSRERRNGLFARIVRVERWRIHRGCPLPYACAIAAGFLFVTL